jgi:secreted Zn-dependent insulinase-like peptidase
MRSFGCFSLVLGLLLAAPSWAQAPAVSPSDTREYRALRLDNGLRVLLISDPATDKAAASLDVNVGSSSDPKDREGLAHFLEHMLFLGTEKYPVANEYQDVLTSHGGTHNAFTAAEHTNYFFDVDKDFLEPVLDRFAQFFIAPLFSEQYVTREKNAVDSEYRARLRNDSRRMWYVWKQLINPEHPFAKFATGNLETLQDDPDRPLRDELIRFYEAHYSANIMTLVVLGKEPLDTLASWVTAKFAAIPNRGRDAAAVDVALFEKGRLPARVAVKSIKDEPSLHLSFPVPAPRAHYRKKPLFYIAHLVGHEGAGSLLSVLKARGWANGLAAGPEFENGDWATFGVSIDLTREGLHHIDAIVDHAFAYFSLVAAAGVREPLFEEQAKLLALQFQYQDKNAPQGYVTMLARALHDYPLVDVLRAEYAMDEFDEDLIRDYLGRLRPDNVVVMIAAPDVRTDRREPRFGAEYRLDAIAAETLANWADGKADASFALPHPNPFVPEHLALHPLIDAGDTPKLIVDKNGLEVWYQQDARFRQPKADVFLNVRSRFANDTARHAVLTELFVELVKDELNEELYPAILAGLEYSIYKHVRGISIKISGYDEKQPELLQRVIDGMVDLGIDAERFALIKTRLQRTLANKLEDPPYLQAIGQVSDALTLPHWSERRQLDALQTLTPEDLKTFIPEYFGRASLAMLIHGNVTPAQGQRLADLVGARLLSRLTPVEVERARVLSLPAGRSHLYQFNVPGKNSAVLTYLQGADASLRQRATYQLLTQIISSPFYSSLRTEQQLGYIVFGFALPMLEAPGLALAVQSTVAEVATINERIEAFLADFESIIAAMSETELAAYRNAVLTLIFDKEDKLADVSNRYWQEIDRQDYTFDSRERLAAAVRNITTHDLLAFYREAILSSAGRRYLRIIAQSEEGTMQATGNGTIRIDDLESFKRNGPFIDLRPN